MSGLRCECRGGPHGGYTCDWCRGVQPPERETPDMTGLREHVCDSGYFDRTLCAEPCGAMHSYCDTCGRRADPCAHESVVNLAARREQADAGDVEALTEALRTPHPDGYTSPLQSDYVRRLVAEAILASDWLANHVAAAREADRAEVERLTRLAADRFKDRARERERRERVEERLAGLVAKIEALAAALEAGRWPTRPRGGAVDDLRALIPADAATEEDQ